MEAQLLEWINYYGSFFVRKFAATLLQLQFSALVNQIGYLFYGGLICD
jgi:hypothetical protein